MKNKDQYVKVWVQCPYLKRLQTRFVDIDSVPVGKCVVLWDGKEIGYTLRSQESVREEMEKTWMEWDMANKWLEHYRDDSRH